MALSGTCYNHSMSNCCKDTKKCCGIGFHSIPAALGDDTGEFKPENGAYHNMLVKYEENGAIYLYTNDGVPIKIPGGCEGDTPIEVDISIAEGESWWLRGRGLDKGSGQSISSRVIPVADITSSADSSVHYTLGDIFNLIEIGKDVIFNGVPLNYSGDNTAGGVALIPPYYNTGKLRMGSRIESDREIEPGEIATVVTWSGITLVSDIPLGYGIERQTHNGTSSYTFYAQGIETHGGPIL